MYVLVRLVSAFRDKLERLHVLNPKSYKDDYYFNLYGKRITSLFRKQAVLKFGKDALYSKVWRWKSFFVPFRALSRLSPFM